MQLICCLEEMQFLSSNKDSCPWSWTWKEFKVVWYLTVRQLVLSWFRIQFYLNICWAATILFVLFDLQTITPKMQNTLLREYCEDCREFAGCQPRQSLSNIGGQLVIKDHRDVVMQERKGRVLNENHHYLFSSIIWNTAKTKRRIWPRISC